MVTGDEWLGIRLGDIRRSRIVISSEARNLSCSPINDALETHFTALFHTACALSAPSGHLPLEGKADDTRIPSSKKTAHYPCEPIRSPYRHPERSRGIFIALPHYARMRPLSNDTLVLPFSPFPRSRFISLQEGSLHFSPHDTQERRIVSHPLSYRCVELCLSEALYPAPLARAVWPHRKAPSWVG